MNLLYQLLVNCLFAQFALCVAIERTLAEYYPGDSSRHVPDTYFVHLEANYTLESHFNYIGTDLRNDKFLHYSSINVYSVIVESHVIHDLIRTDPHVTLVTHSHALDAPVLMDVKIVEDSLFSKIHNRLVRRWERREANVAWWIAHIATWGKRPTGENYIGESTAFLDHAGSGVNVYILDSGIKMDHFLWDQGGRPINFKNDISTPFCGGGLESMDDFEGHGTHVAGIVKQSAYDATLVNVKVRCREEPWFRERGMLDALDQIRAEHIDYKNGKDTPSGWKGSVINMSMDAGRSPELQLMIASVTDAGIPVVTSAGNGGPGNAPTGPCGLPKVQCVGATSKTYFSPEFSNWSNAVTLMAPGVSILSAGIYGRWCQLYASGTSQAAPMVAGTAAIFVGFEGIKDNVDLVNTRLSQNAQSGLFSPRQSYKDALMVNHGMFRPDRDARYPYAGPQWPQDKLDIFDGTNTFNDFPKPTEAFVYNPNEFPEDGSVYEGLEPGVGMPGAVLIGGATVAAGSSDPVPT